MSNQVHTDRHFDKITLLPPGDFEGCRFTHCDLGGTELSGINFTECVFEDSNLSGCKILQTTFNDVRFVRCKILGLHFESASQYLFAVGFEHSSLDLSSFYQCKMKKTVFSQSSLQETDFTETVLTEAVFDGCNLRGAKFENTVLEKADLRTAINFSINPEINKVRKARFAYPAVLALLDKYEIVIS
jgi:fluoroquinolone resistance protein